MLYHPECESNEIFVGNVLLSMFPAPYLKSLQTIRIGIQAYEIDGKPIDICYMRPMFVGKTEASEYDRIMMDRLRTIMKA